MRSNDAEFREMAQRLLDLEARIDGLSKPQLGHSSLENQAIREYDADGQLVQIIGRQYDGTHGAVVVGGPVPPTPTGLALETVNSGVRAIWRGEFEHAAADQEAGRPTVAPQDFRHVEFELSESPDFVEGSPIRGGLRVASEAGGQVFVPWEAGASLHIRARCWSLAGKASPWSAVVGPVEAGKIGVGDLGFDIATLGGTRIFYGPTDPAADPDVTPAYGDLWQREVTPGPPPQYRIHRWAVVDGTDGWQELADQGVVDAAAQAIAAQQAADSKAKLFTQDTQPAWSGGAGTAYWINTAAGNAPSVWDGTGWAPHLLGSGAIQPQSLVASDVIATGTVTAALFEALMVLANTVVAGPNGIEGPHAALSGEGLRLVALNPEGVPQQTGALGTGADGLTFTDPATRQTTVSLQPSGTGGVLQFDVAGVDADGDGTPDSGLTVYGREYLDWLGDKANGAVGSGFFADAENGVFASNITTPFGLGEVSFLARAGRNYLVMFDGLHFSSTVAGTRGLVHVRFTTDGSTPTIGNGAVASSKVVDIREANAAISAAPNISFGSFGAADVTVRCLVVVERLAGIGSITAHTYGALNNYRAPFRFFAAEMGRDIPDTYIANDGGGVRAGGTPSATPKVTYTTTWAPSFVGSYLGGGGRRTDTSDMLQGYTGYYPAGGTQRSIAGFTGGALAASHSGELGKTITGATAGATITRVEIGLHCNHSHSTAGGTASIGYHGNTTLPATYPNSQYGAFSDAFFQRGQTRWMTLPASTHAAWRDGTYRGITLGPNGDYMRFDGSAGRRPGVRITYTR